MRCEETSPIAAGDLENVYSARWQSDRKTGEIGDHRITAVQSSKFTGSTGLSLAEKSR